MYLIWLTFYFHKYTEQHGNIVPFEDYHRKTTKVHYENYVIDFFLFKGGGAGA